jgi:hypothetical protein
MARDIYRGYEIDYSVDHEGYRVFKGGELVHTSQSYDGAALWIDQKRREELGMKPK